MNAQFVCNILDYVVQSHMYKGPKMRTALSDHSFLCKFFSISFNLIIEIFIVMDTMLNKLYDRIANVEHNANGCYHSPLLHTISFSHSNPNLKWLIFDHCCCFLDHKN